MTLSEGVIRDHVFIDFGTELLFGDDQMDVNYPCRFATVTFQLMSTELLSGIADRIRLTEGYKPMHPIDNYTEEMCDEDGWYDFYYGISTLDGGSGDSCIVFSVVGSDSDDNEECYFIDLSADEQQEMYERIDEECWKYLGKGCKELLAEAEQKMLEKDETEARF